ncbi:hypothetical protein [Micromonospora radicis]|uniref:Uncharacterized protein n=1 Tax=Micromonospora radicis TaxID=1894971 RepID=A0A418MW50_9ACTN|nr:hypothetical protein [Micromonospora radicis]RIV39115.1 hypothetical protein D2L64_09590 [Micromonospora radicis]
MRPLTYAVALVAGLALTGAPAPDPRVGLDRSEAKPGERVLVRLTGWPAGTVVIELCDAGTPPRCAVDTSAQIHLPGTGSGGAPLTVAAPPGGCPCRVRVTTLDTRLSAGAALVVTGARPTAVGAAAPTAIRPVVIADAQLERDDGWAAYFGLASRRTLVLRLRNEQAAPAPVSWSFSVGRGPEPTGFVVPPVPPDLGAGEEREVRIPVALPAPALGAYQIHGEIVTAGTSSRVTASTEHQPWGLAGLLGLVAAVLAATEVRRHRARSAPH